MVLMPLQNPEQNRSVQDSEKSWAPLLQDISTLSNIDEQTETWSLEQI